MQDKTINNALIALHKAGGEQAELARQLLHMRGINPPRLVTPCQDRFRRGHMRRAILEALTEGPKTGPEIVRHVMQHREGWAFNDAQRRVSTALTKMKQAGLVRREGRVWLAQ